MKTLITSITLSLLHYTHTQAFVKNHFEKMILKSEIELAQNILQVTQQQISPLCYTILSDSFTKETIQEQYLTKLIHDSGKHFNDLGCYVDCFYKRHKINYDLTTENIESNLTYVIYSIKYEDKAYFGQSKLLGACLPVGCLESEYVTLFRAFSQLIQIDFINEDTIIRAYDIKEGKTKQSIESDKLSNNYYPLYFLLCILSLSFIPKLISNMFKRLNTSSSSRKKTSQQLASITSSSPTRSDSRESRIKDYKKKLLPRFIVNLRKLKSCFDVSENSSEIKHKKISSHDICIINDTGLNITSGLRGIAMILIVLGLVFELLNDSPMKLLHLKKIMHFFRSLSFSFIIFCRRFGTNLSYSVSGLCLTYKLLCYLDIEITKLDSLAISNENEYGESAKLSHIEVLSKVPSITDLIIEEESGNYLKYRSKIHIKRLIYFYYRQLYKYILFIAFVLFFKYSYWLVISRMSTISPMWIYMKEELINLFSFSNVLSTIFLYDLYIPSNKFPNNPFSTVINEVSYFIFGSMMIYYFYKKNYRLDKFILYVCGLFSILKLILFFTLLFQRDRTKKYFPAKNFTDNYYSFIQNNSLYNSPIFLIGVFFGLVNYAYQKSIEMSYSKASKTNKKMLILPMKFISFFQGLTQYNVRICSTVFISSFIAIIFGFYLLFSYLLAFIEGRPNDFFENVFANVYFLYDIDIATWLLYLALYPLCFAGDNFLIYFLKHDYWTYVSRPYFVFLLISNMVVYYIFYQSDSKIQIDFVNIAFFGLLAILILFILNTLIYIFFDLPLKKLSKTIIYAYEQNNDDVDCTKNYESKSPIL